MESMVKKLTQSMRVGWFRKRNEKDMGVERWFMENGNKFLKELIADCNGKSIPIRSFSYDQILKATSNFDSSCHLVTHFWGEKWYKGIIKDKPYLIKRFSVNRIEEACNDIVLSARMSNHNNFLKLIGCCLEFPVPVLVFEYAESGILNEQGRVLVNGEETILPLSLRLKIAKEVAIALTYLHEAFPKITVHRDVKSTNIFLDKNLTAKLSGLSYAITIPEGKSIIEDTCIAGTPGYLDLAYYYTGTLTEYIDVYSFGILLMVILTGRPAIVSSRSNGDYKEIVVYVRRLYENGKLDEVIDPVMMKDITSGQMLQVEACLVLALNCCKVIDNTRPKMIQVAKELKRIERIEC